MITTSGDRLTTGTATLTTTPLITPLVNATIATAGAGTLASGTYRYRITAINTLGETTGSEQTACTITGPAGVNVAWTAVSGATGYKIYGRTNDPALLMATVGAVTTWLDDGSITPSGALPLGNSTGGLISTRLDSFGPINSTAASGSDAFTASFPGCRLSLGSLSRYMMDNGGSFTLNTGFSATQVFSTLFGYVAGTASFVGGPGSESVINYLGLDMGSAALLGYHTSKITRWTNGVEKASLDANGIFTAGLSAFGAVGIRGLSTPINLTHTLGAGTLATGTYYYRVSATNQVGESIASAETSLAITGPAGVNVNWNTVPGAVNYKIYGRTTGAEQLIATVVPWLTSGGVQTYLDSGAISPSGALPTVNTSGGFSGGFTINAMPTPVNGTHTSASSGGSLAAGTYYYRVSALNQFSETLASTETSIVIASGSSNRVNVVWQAVPGAYGYKVYGRTTGAELLIATVADGTTTYSDTGAITPSGALPTANATSRLTITGTPTGGDSIIIPDQTRIQFNGAGGTANIYRAPGSGLKSDSTLRVEGGFLGNVFSGVGGGIPMGFTAVGSDQAEPVLGTAGYFNTSSTWTLGRLYSYRNFSAEKSWIGVNGTYHGGLQAVGAIGIRGLSAPVCIAHTLASGTLATGSYYYRVSATSGAGESLAGAEVGATIVSGPAGLNVNWTPVPGATGYKIYGRATGAELLLATVTGGNTATYLDDGSLTPAGALPSVNTSGGYLGGLTISKLSTPIPKTFLVSNLGGSLTAGTYYYRISAIDAVGETLASTETNLAISGAVGNRSIAIYWHPVPGAMGYKIYGRTTGAELLLSTVTGDNLYYLDDNSATPSGALPGSNTTSANISTVGSVTGSNLSGTNTGDVTIGTANGLSLVGQTLSLAAAGGLAAGAVSTGTQTFAGDKTFTGLTEIAYPGIDNTALYIHNTVAGGSAPTSANATFIEATVTLTGVETITGGISGTSSYAEVTGASSGNTNYIAGMETNAAYTGAGTCAALIGFQIYDMATTGTVTNLAAINISQQTGSATDAWAIRYAHPTNPWNVRTDGDMQTSGRVKGTTLITTDTVLTSSHHKITVDATAGNVTLTLPAASITGREFVVKRVDASGNTVTITRAGADTIEGSNTTTLAAQWSTVTLTADGGTTWLKF